MRLSVVSALGLGLFLGTPALHAEEYGGPAPSLDDAMALAKKAGKPLVIELSAVW